MKIQMEVRWPRILKSRMRRFGAVALVTLVALGVPSALAIHDFTDVPDSNPFHSEISALKNAGITGGKTCVPPTASPSFCPDEPVVRQAMAAFLNRGLSRVANSQTITDATIEFSGDFPTDVVVGQVTINVGGTGAGANQFVQLQAELSLGDNSTAAATVAPPYFVSFYLAEGDQSINRSIIHTQRITVADNPNDTVAISWARAAAPGAHTYKVHAWATTPGAVATVSALSFNATTHAFGSTGASTLGTTPTNQPRPGR